MAGNMYFSHGSEGLSSEYSLYNDACDEIVEIWGINFYFLKRELQKHDWVLGESVISHFSEAIEFCFYVENADGFDGQNEMFQKFGFSLEQNMTLTCQQERFFEMIGREPLEDDLVYHIPSQKIFMIKSIKKENSYYQMGGGGLRDSGRMMYNFTMALFTSSHENFQTDVEEIDFISDKTDVNTPEEKNAFDTEQSVKLDFNESDIFGAA